MDKSLIHMYDGHSNLLCRAKYDWVEEVSVYYRGPGTWVMSDCDIPKVTCPTCRSKLKKYKANRVKELQVQIDNLTSNLAELKKIGV